MRKIILLVILFFVGQILFAQNFITVTGIIKSKKDSCSLPYVNIYLEETNIGTISNEVGAFEFHIPYEFKNSCVCFKNIGYKTKKIEANRLSKDTTFVYLNCDTININEVVVLPQGITPEIIMKDAIKQIPKNYARKQCYFDAFYREMALTNNEYTRLIETAIEIQDFGFDSDDSRRKIKVVELRKSDDYIKRDFFTKVTKLFFSDDNELVWTVNTFDFVKQMHNNQSYMLNNFTHSIEGITKYDGMEVYIIKSEKKESPLFYDWMKFYINKEDMAFVQIEFHREIDQKIKCKKPDFYEKNKDTFTSNSITKYIKTNNNYYLNFIKEIMPFDLIRSKDGGPMQKQSFIKELMINNIYTERKQYSRIKSKEALQKDEDLYEQEFSYDSSFWENYNVLLINPLLKEAAVDLSKKTELEKQFISNGK